MSCALWSDPGGGNIETILKLLIGEWSHQKRKGRHLVSVDKVSRRGCRLQSVMVCYDLSIPHGLSVSLTMCL